MPYRLHRSWSFWFGLPGLIFLIWAWTDSMKYQSQITLYRGVRGSTDTFRQFLGTIDLRWWLNTPEPNAPLRDWRWMTKREPHPHRDVAARPITIKKEDFSYANVRKVRAVVILPYWFLLTAYLVPWLGLICWRWKKHRDHRKLTGQLAVEPVRENDLR